MAVKTFFWESGEEVVVEVEFPAAWGIGHVLI